MNSKKKVELTQDEQDRFEDAMKKPEFRKMFFEYMDEIRDPQNRKLYEAELAKYEKQLKSWF